MKYVFFLIALAGLLCGCAGNLGYEQITAEEAKRIMDVTEGYLILDVCTGEEYDRFYISGDVPILHAEIGERAVAELPDKD